MKPLLAFLLLLSAAALPAQAAADPSDSVAARLARLTPLQTDEVLWLARCVYSESNLPHEQRLVAWVVRNRVETRYRGATYREVVLETKQFSAFNTPSPRREHILGLQLDSTLPAWRKVLQIALDVYLADPGERPFPVSTRHFYSPISMEGGKTPTWAQGVTPLDSKALGVDPVRFQFFSGIDTQYAGTPATALQTPRLSEPAAEQTERARSSDRRPRLRLSGRIPRPTRPTVQPARQQ